MEPINDEKAKRAFNCLMHLCLEHWGRGRDGELYLDCKGCPMDVGDGGCRIDRGRYPSCWDPFDETEFEEYDEDLQRLKDARLWEQQKGETE